MNSNYYYDYNTGAWMLKSAAHAEMVKAAGYNVQMYKQASFGDSFKDRAVLDFAAGTFAGGLGGIAGGLLGIPIGAIVGGTRDDMTWGQGALKGLKYGAGIGGGLGALSGGIAGRALGMHNLKAMSQFKLNNESLNNYLGDLEKTAPIIQNAMPRG